MITVTVSINGNVIYTRSAISILETNKKGEHAYEVDTGVKIYHKRDKGFVPLVKKMLDTVIELKSRVK